MVYTVQAKPIRICDKKKEWVIPTPLAYNYCATCGGELIIAHDGQEDRPHCEPCNRFFVQCVLRHDSVLLCRSSFGGGLKRAPNEVLLDCSWNLFSILDLVALFAEECIQKPSFSGESLQLFLQKRDFGSPAVH